MSRAKLSEEEKKARDRERARKYYQSHKKDISEKHAAYKATHKEEIAAKRAAYYQEHKEERAAYAAAYYQEQREEKLAYQATYRAENKDKKSAYDAEYRASKHGRALRLVNNCNRWDKKRGFDTSQNIDAAWVEANVFNGQSCIYCGDSDWTHLGCDRIDNSKPHTPENVVCACFICNSERSDNFSVEEFKEYRKLHPRTLGTGIEKSWEISELPNGLKVIKKKQVPASV